MRSSMQERGRPCWFGLVPVGVFFSVLLFAQMSLASYIYTYDDTVTYSWIDISSTGTGLQLGDDSSASVDIPFSFNGYMTVHVNSNGTLNFLASSTAFGNQCLPVAGYDLAVMPFWDDLNPSAAGSVFYEVQGSAPNRSLVVQWNSVPRFGVAGDTTFQVILHEDDTVLFQYQDVDFGNAAYDNGASATVGVQSNNTTAAQYSCNSASLSASLAILFTPTGQSLNPSVLSTTSCSGRKNLTLEINNRTGSDHTYPLSYTVTSAHGRIYGPDSVGVTNGSTKDVNVFLRTEDNFIDPLTVTVTADGFGGEKLTSDITLSHSSWTDGSWNGMTDAPVGVRHPAVAAYSKYLFMIGGENPWPAPFKSVYRYDTGGDTWVARADMPMELTGIQAAAIDGSIFVPGGSDSTNAFVDTLHVYNISTNTWTTGASLPVTLAWSSAVTDGIKLFVIGGILGDKVTLSNKLYIYDPTLDTWSTGADMTLARQYASAAYINGKIYVAGGVTTSGLTLNMEVYDIATDSWSAGPDLPDPVGLSGTGWDAYNGGVVDSRYFIVYGGGASTTQCGQSEVVMYDPQDGYWQLLPELNRCNYGSKGASVGKTFYRIGGRTNVGGWQYDMTTEYLDLVKCTFPWPMFRAATSNLDK